MGDETELMRRVRDGDAAAFDALPAPHRQVVRLVHELELNVREAADALDIPPGTVKSRLHHARKILARGSAAQLRNAVLGAVIADLDRRLSYVPHGFLDGHTPEEVFKWAIGSRRGLAQTVLAVHDLAEARSGACLPTGFNVLARARRSKCPGKVLARAAAIGEIDPLRDPDSRLFVGLRP